MNKIINALMSKRTMELLIGKLLRYGVITACTISVCGGIVYLVQHYGETNARYMASEISTDAFIKEHGYKHIGDVFNGLQNFDGEAIILLGVCVLIATPVIRVAFSAIAFLVEKDYMYVTITLIVLAIILANMFLGLH